MSLIFPAISPAIRISRTSDCLLRHRSNQSLIRDKLVSESFGRRHNLWFSPGHCRINLQTGRQYKVKSEDSEGILSSESITLDEQTLEEELQSAIAEENYGKAAKIRDTLKDLQKDSKTSLLVANNRFYDSFRAGDLAAMQTLWAKKEEVCCVHPGVKGISGYDNVIESWEFVWANYEFPLEIKLKDETVYVKGDVGYVTCMEFVKTKGSRWGGQYVTNVFERIDGHWYICIHHASPVDL
ncbi:F-box protein SKIP8 [Quillaja saponaria]|uniref:F-box protein SKIP8 n=1 Tax=Quillaja saponaria TaxID=32244 RepID=A0AAD7LEG2_QUISA|nr:F-box protein SKIP8 [Quillaja saponaria]